MATPVASSPCPARARVHAWLGEQARPSTAATLTRRFLEASMVVAVVTAVLATLPGLPPSQGNLLAWTLNGAMLVFTLECLGRLWVAPLEQQDGQTAAAARRHYLLSFGGLVDLAVVLPWLGSLTFQLGPDPVILAALLSLLKLGRHSPSLAILGAVLRQEGRALLAGLLVMLVLWLLAAGVMYLLERQAQPASFGSIPQSMWWAVVTIATVGYGDVTPITVPGKIFGGLTMLLGVAMFAIPAGILANGFAQELRRRDFVVNWRAVAAVPLFAGLDAGRIAGIAELLKVRLVPAHQVVVRRGDSADAMYFIQSGEVAVALPEHTVRLGRGQFFGEIALLRDVRRTATVTTLRECRLLALGVDEFRRLMERNPELRAAVELEAERRLSEAH